MTSYEYACSKGHRFVQAAPMGQAAQMAPCPICGAGELGRRVFSVPTLVTSYPMGLGESIEQVVRDREQHEREYVRPSNEVVMDRVRAELFDREHRTDGQQRWQGTEI